jgi:predicted RNA-binding protein with EMAP domain
LGKREKWIDVSSDYKILLTTINAEEEVEIFKACRNELGFGYLAKNKFEVLARAIKGINEKTFKYLEMEDGPERVIEREKTIETVRKKIESWHDDIVSFLYAE